MARGPQRHVEERIYEIIKAAKALNFKIVLADYDWMEGDIQRVEPPIKPDVKPQLIFYIRPKAWESFKAVYFINDLSFPLLAGIEIEEPTPSQEKGNGENTGR